MAAIICMFFCSVSSNGGHILLWLRKVCIWLRKGYVGHRKIWWGHGWITPPCLHWYTTIVTWRRRNSSKWWYIILLCISFLGHRRSFSYNPSLLFFFAGTRSPSSNLSSSPQEKVLTFLPKRDKFTLATLSLLSHLHLCICLSSYIQMGSPG
jgi:hypothetical protein